METLFGGLSRWSDGDDRLPTLDAHYTIDYPFLGSNEVGSTWILLDNPTYDCVPAYKGEHLADALLRSKMVEIDIINSSTTKGDQVEEVSVMTRSSIVATEEVEI